METSVQLQPLMAFGIHNVIVAVILLVAAILLARFALRKDKRATPVLTQRTQRTSPALKKKYISQLDEIKRQLIEGKIDSRSASEKTSTVVRQYVKKAKRTDINHLTLEELESKGINDIVSIVSICYADEFPLIPKNKSLQAIEEAQDFIREDR